MKTMIEFFSGSKVMSNVFKKEGYKVFTIDFNKKLNPDLCVNILDFTIDMLPKRFRKPTVVWFSTPCTAFSVASIYVYWINGKPKTSKTYIGLAIAKKSFELAEELNPKFWFIENPRGMLRKQHFVQNIHRKTVTYCQYGKVVQKPTDIFTNAVHWIPKKMCLPGSPCHEIATRGAKTGTQGIYNKNWEDARSSDGFERAKLPIQLCEEILLVCEGKQKIKQTILDMSQDMSQTVTLTVNQPW